VDDGSESDAEMEIDDAFQRDPRSGNSRSAARPEWTRDRVYVENIHAAIVNRGRRLLAGPGPNVVVTGVPRLFVGWCSSEHRTRRGLR
jgi:hypothetical protein